MRKTAHYGLVCAGLLAGCSTAMVEPHRKEAEAVSAKATAHLAAIPQQAYIQPKLGEPERDSGIWLPVRKIRETEVASGNSETGRRQIAVNREFRTIQDVAERITLLTGVPVIVSPDAATAGPGGLPQQPGAPGQAQQPQPVVPAIAGAPAPPYNLTGANATVPLSYSGPLSGFLDVAAARFGVSWEWQGSRIRFFKYVTKTFSLAALPGDMTLQSTISNQSGGTSGGPSATGSSATSSSATSSTQQTGVSFSGLSIWRAVEDSIKGMLSKEGKVTVTAATGSVTVTDTPQIVAQVERFLDQQNAALSRQVFVDVRILSVDLTNTNEYGINWNLVFNALSGNFGWTFRNVFPTDPNSSALSLKILSTAGATTNANIKAWAGSEAIISALSTQGHVSEVTTGSVTTLNNQASPLQVGRQTSFLASSTTTITQGAGATTALQPGLITTGFSMNVLPHILDKGRLMLQYTINLSSLIGITTVTSGGSSIQTPEIDTRDFLQRVILNSGDTLVLTGFEQSRLSAQTQGMGNADNVALGGGVNGRKSRTVLVILIKPVIMDAV
ncbi:MAG: PilN family type IVB pilus formation outer membrane protein [Pseudomonadota bacterium]|jgi:type IVB pilus formation R64 PilN family outer membrane protein